MDKTTSKKVLGSVSPVVELPTANTKHSFRGNTPKMVTPNLGQERRFYAGVAILVNLSCYSTYLSIPHSI